MALKTETLKILCLFVYISLVTARDDRWVWNNDYNRDVESSQNVNDPIVDSYGRVLGPGLKTTRQRYAVTEYEEFPLRPPQLNGPLNFDEEYQSSYIRPTYISEKPGIYEEIPNKIASLILGVASELVESYQTEYGQNQRPGGSFGTNQRPGGALGTNQRPGLPGNKQSGEYDRCKCTQSFNCPASAVKFGTCDTDKQYCCFSTRGGKSQGFNRPGPVKLVGGPGRGSNGNVYDPSLGVLVGPSGPTGHIGRPGKSSNGNIYDPSLGVLVGPGGPTGVTNRGPKGFNGNVYDPSLGVLVGPGGPTGVINPNRKVIR